MVLPASLAECYLLYLSCKIPDVLNPVLINKGQGTVLLFFPRRWQDIVLPLLLSLNARYRISSPCLEKSEIANFRIRPFTYIFTPWSRVLLEKLIGFQLVKKFPAFYGTRRFIITFTSALQLSLSRANSMQLPQPPPTS